MGRSNDSNKNGVAQEPLIIMGYTDMGGGGRQRQAAQVETSQPCASDKDGVNGDDPALAQHLAPAYNGKLGTRLLKAR